jgi:hypothetical protein
MDGTWPGNSQVTRDAVADLAGAVGRLVLSVAKLQTAITETRLAVIAASSGDLTLARQAADKAGASVNDSARESDAVTEELLAILQRMATPHG